MFSKKYSREYGSQARTLRPSDIGTKGMWTVSGKIIEDYYEWVNYFEAEHLILGKVWGNFEEEVFADDEETFNEFMKHYQPSEWDYYGI